MRIIITIILVLSSSFWCFGQSKKAKNFIQEYSMAAHQDLNGKLLNIKKWELIDTLKYTIIGDMKYMSKKDLRKYLNKLENLTNIKIIEVTSEEQANITMFFGDLDIYLKMIESGYLIPRTNTFDNWSSRKHNNKNQLTSSGFCVDIKRVKSKKRARWLIKSGWLKSLGILGTLDSDRSVLFKYNTKNNSNLNKIDKRIIKMHYSNNIKSNMSSEEVQSILSTKINIDEFLDEKI